jgi:DNA-binding XRE family transcriptional regulator
VSIPDHYRTGHEAHFAEVTRQFLRYLEKKEKLPTWEKPNMLAKYFVTTGGVALSRKG